MNPSSEREAFEREFRAVYPMACSAGALGVDEAGDYTELETRIAHRMWCAALSTQPQQAGWRPIIDVAYMDGEKPFIFAVHGRATVEILESIEKELAENPPEKGDGDYRYEATHFEGQYGEYGVCEIAPGWELSEISFTPAPLPPVPGQEGGIGE